VLRPYRRICWLRSFLQRTKACLCIPVRSLGRVLTETWNLSWISADSLEQCRWVYRNVRMSMKSRMALVIVFGGPRGRGSGIMPIVPNDLTESVTRCISKWSMEQVSWRECPWPCKWIPIACLAGVASDMRGIGQLIDDSRQVIGLSIRIPTVPYVWRGTVRSVHDSMGRFWERLPTIEPRSKLNSRFTYNRHIPVKHNARE
jgi:hypothetical protein